ncbi:hypothetical protein [Adhaeribacter pallidiroseus]|uniref:Polysaccharide chain length determinant N-terminal domain-containing protein n=1 Tax=Adhaeribacter pallidiroseus TaxID=2072847 RepID=A0A369QDH9_9BACT|nr:hypothetical protein [Adhaeribacter pallidiroseus]RDC62961.1 hypothetical protein AHMF7616_01560 [Adhaeribacter pallidiroseus]
MDYSEPNLNKKNPENNDEIDLSKLLSAVGKAITALIKSVVRFFFLAIDSTFANYKVITSLIIIFGLLGIGYHLNVKPYYESKMTLNSAYYKGEFLGNSIQNLNRLCGEGNYRVLANLLKINPEKAKTLRKIEVEQIISPNMQMLIDLYKSNEGNQRRLDSIILNHSDSTFQIMVQVYDTTTLVGLDTTLVNYIKNNKFVNKRIAIERKNLLNRRAKLIRESKNLDTLKKYMAQSYLTRGTGKEGTNVTLNDKESDPINVYREDFRLYDQQLQIDRLLFINSEIEIIDRFITFGKPASGTLEKHAAKGAIIGLLLGLLYVFYLILRDGLRNLRTAVQEE